MIRKKGRLLGYLYGIASDGSPATVSVYESGRNFRISFQHREHFCHPSVRSIPKLKAEALLVFHIKDAEYEPL